VKTCPHLERVLLCLLSFDHHRPHVVDVRSAALFSGAFSKNARRAGADPARRGDVAAAIAVADAAAFSTGVGNRGSSNGAISVA